MNPSRTVSSLALIGVFVFSLFFTSAHPALADPHATFFTSVGQQQLFFNMLASLNQADYVEPAVDTLATAGADSREELLKKRTETTIPILGVDPDTGDPTIVQEITFEPEKNPTLNATKTDLASLITRSVTLEGNDVWSTYLAQQFALEGVRRRNATELLKIYCERGLGVKDCDLAAEKDPKKQEARRESSLVADPLGPLKAVAKAGRAALLSGFAPEYDQEVRRDITDPNSLETDKYRPYDSYIADLADQSGSGTSTSQDYKQTLVDQWLSSALNINEGVTQTSFLDVVEFNDDGEVIFPESTSLESVISYMSSAYSAPAGVLEARLAAETRQEEINQYKNTAGARALTFAKPAGGTTPDGGGSSAQAASGTSASGHLGEITEEILIPAYARAGQTIEAIGIPSEGELNPYAISGNEGIPGGTQFEGGSGTTGPGGGATGPVTAPGGGATAPGGVTSQIPSSGQVAGVATGGLGQEDFFSGDPDDGVSVPERSFTRTEGISDFLLLLGGSQRGCGCSLQSILGGYGGNILGP